MDKLSFALWSLFCFILIARIIIIIIYMLERIFFLRKSCKNKGIVLVRNRRE